MPHSNRRQADRVPVGILAQLGIPEGHLTAQVRDLSRTGLRVRATLSDLGIERPEDEDTATERVTAKLRKRFELSLNHDRLGSLLQRRTELIRVEMPDVEEEALDLCCQFLDPLEQDEVELLESHLPPVRENRTPVAQARIGGGRVVGGVRFESTNSGPMEVPPPHKNAGVAHDRPRQRYRAFVSTSRSDTLQTFRCHTDLITGIGVRIAVPRKGYGDTTKGAARQFVQRYGAHLDLRLSDDTLDIWSGRVRVSGVELPSTRTEVMLVTLAFDRALALNELRSLGLLAKVA